MTRTGLVGWFVVAVVAVAGCTDAAEPVVATVSAPGGRWIAVRTDEAPAWQRIDAPVARIETAGVFEAVVVCREDIGDGWSLLATVADGPEWQFPCATQGGASAVFDVTGPVTSIFVGGEAAFGPDFFSAEVAPGRHDVVAVLSGLDGLTTERVQVLRDVMFTDGATTRVAIDVAGRGAAPGTADVVLNGVAPSYVGYTGYTASGTWFTLAHRAGVALLPPELRVDGDRELGWIPDREAWAEVELHPGLNQVELTLPPVAGTLSSDGAVALSWPASPVWDEVRLYSSRLTADGQIDRPMWSLRATRGAIAARTTDGVTRLSIDAPDVPGWQADWLPDLAGPHRRAASWRRVRPDGLEGWTTSDRISPSP